MKPVFVFTVADRFQESLILLGPRPQPAMARFLLFVGGCPPAAKWTAGLPGRTEDSPEPSR